jgi:hypothetical protein
MSNLTVANVQKCLGVIKDFHNADASALTPEELSAKKKNAGLALNHLSNLFNPTPGGFDPANGPECINCGFMIQATE